ncbi:MAG: hypothetical protein KJ580_05810, partial [Nanoarchaeota archaeon]|nr:hypothetical protein [Nanoarchaeota archaeon]
INLSSAAAQTTSVTYMAWLKPADAGWRRIFNNASLSDLGWYTNSQVVKRYGCSIESTAGSVPTDQWTHFAYTYDGSTSRIYINGLLDVSNSNDCRELGGIKYIGKDDGVEDFSGSIDEVMIFNRSLSAEQILALYNNRTDLIVSQETFPGDVWNVSITPNDGNDDGTMLTSNSVLIQDTATPSITVQSPTNNSQLLSVVNLTFSVGDDAGVDQCWYSLDDGANTTLSGCANTSITPGGGIHNITFYVNDTSNNINSSGLINFSVNYLPTIDSLILNSTNPANNDTNQNLTAYSTTSDTDGGSVKVIYNWLVNGTSQLLFNVPLEPSLDLLNGTDYSGFGINANGIIGSPYFNSTGGHDGKGAYQFNASPPSAISFNAANFPAIGTGNYTFEAWVKTNSSKSYQAIWVAKNSGGSYLLSFYIYNNAGSSGLAVINGGSGRYSDVNNNLLDNNWHHVAFVREGNGTNQLKFYIDSIHYGSKTDSFSQPAPASIFVGWTNNTSPPTYDFNGTIDEVRLWNRSLSVEQILAIYNNRTDLIVSNETKIGENWTVQGTPNDGKEDGVTLNSNSLIITVPDTTSPTFSNPSNTSLNFRRYQNFTANITIDDETALDYYIFSTNSSGSWVNTSARDISGNAQHNASEQANISIAQGSPVCWLYYANDTSGNMNNSDTYCFTVANSIPTHSTP